MAPGFRLKKVGLGLRRKLGFTSCELLRLWLFETCVASLCCSKVLGLQGFEFLLRLMKCPIGSAARIEDEGIGCLKALMPFFEG